MWKLVALLLVPLQLSRLQHSLLNPSAIFSTFGILCLHYTPLLLTSQQQWRHCNTAACHCYYYVSITHGTDGDGSITTVEINDHNCDGQTLWVHWQWSETTAGAATQAVAAGQHDANVPSHRPSSRLVTELPAGESPSSHTSNNHTQFSTVMLHQLLMTLLFSQTYIQLSYYDLPSALLKLWLTALYKSYYYYYF